jgi:hypothetical protein
MSVGGMEGDLHLIRRNTQGIRTLADGCPGCACALQKDAPATRKARRERLAWRLRTTIIGAWGVALSSMRENRR